MSEQWRWVAVAVVAFAVPGCGNPAKEKARESSTLKPLMVLYGQYVGQHRGEPPANEEEFKTFIRAVDPALLESFSVKSADELFVSSRDHKPYVIFYGAVTGPPGPAGQPVVAYEQEGFEGKRYVASMLGAVEEVDEARFRELVPNPK